MSLDQDGLSESNQKPKERGITRTRLVSMELEHSYALAKQRKDMGLPLNESQKRDIKVGEFLEQMRKGK